MSFISEIFVFTVCCAFSGAVHGKGKSVKLQLLHTGVLNHPIINWAEDLRIRCKLTC